VSSSVSFSTSAQTATQSPEQTADAAGSAFVSDELPRIAMATTRAAPREPDLHNLHRSDARIHDVITAGIKGEMPSFGKKLGDPDVRQLIA